MRARSAGFRSSWRSAEHGFTLIELLVALLVFAMIAAAGVVLLSQGVSAQGAIKTRLDDLAAVERASGMIAADLAQAMPRISRTEAGTLAPAFFARGPAGAADAPAVQFIRAGWSNLDGAPRSTLQKLEYVVAGNRLERRSYPLVDGAAPGAPAVLIDGIDAAQFRFRDKAGVWRDDWTPQDPHELPRAAELTLRRPARPPLTLLFVVGTGSEPAHG